MKAALVSFARATACTVRSDGPIHRRRERPHAKRARTSWWRRRRACAISSSTSGRPSGSWAARGSCGCTWSSSKGRSAASCSSRRIADSRSPRRSRNPLEAASAFCLRTPGRTSTNSSVACVPTTSISPSTFFSRPSGGCGRLSAVHASRSQPERRLGVGHAVVCHDHNLPYAEHLEGASGCARRKARRRPPTRPSDSLEGPRLGLSGPVDLLLDAGAGPPGVTAASDRGGLFDASPVALFGSA